MFLRLHLPHISCKELQLKKKIKGRHHWVKVKEKRQKRNGISRLFWFFPREDKLAFASISFCTRCCLIIFWREIQKEDLLKFLPKLLPKLLPGETLCKLVQIFPPKVLIYIRKKFLDPFLIGLIKENVKEIYSLLKVKLLWLIEWETTKK